MRDTDAPAFAAAIAEMFASQGKSCTDKTVSGWWKSLKDLEDTGLVFAGIAHAMASQTRLPFPKDVRDWYSDNRKVAPAPIPVVTPQQKNWPNPREVLVARQMLIDPKLNGELTVLADPSMGRPMLDWIKAHPLPAAKPKPGPLAKIVDPIVEAARRELSEAILDFSDDYEV